MNNAANIQKIIGLNAQLRFTILQKIALEHDRKFLSSNVLIAANERNCNILKRAAFQRFNRHRAIIAKCGREIARIDARINKAAAITQQQKRA